MEPTRPHTAVINVNIEVHALDDIGQCSGKTISASSLEQAGIKPAFLLKVEGNTAEDCLQKLKIKVDKMNEHDG